MKPIDPRIITQSEPQFNKWFFERVESINDYPMTQITVLDQLNYSITNATVILNKHHEYEIRSDRPESATHFRIQYS